MVGKNLSSSWLDRDSKDTTRISVMKRSDGTLVNGVKQVLSVWDQVSSTARLFDDDCLLYRNINATADADRLQDDINRLQKWEADWLMEFNPDKCEIIRITNRRKKKVVNCYSIHGKALKDVTCAKYFGVTIDRKLTWNDHIANITN